jgi:hypothetical protein
LRRAAGTSAFSSMSISGSVAGCCRDVGRGDGGRRVHTDVMADKYDDNDFSWMLHH